MQNIDHDNKIVKLKLIGVCMESFEPGIYEISSERYHASAGLSRSVLWTFKTLPYNYWYKYLSGQYEESADTEALLIGKLVHTLVLEPHLFDEQYYVLPKINRTTKAGKTMFEEILLTQKGKTLIKKEQYDLAVSMKESVYNHELAPLLLDDAVKEKSLYWKDSRTGLLCKARPDIWNNAGMGDLKTVQDASFRSFQSTAYKEGYFLQAAMIFEASKALGIACEEFFFLCVEKKKPYLVSVYRLDNEALQYGISLFHSLLGRFLECQKANKWPGYGIQTLYAPSYANLELGQYE